MTNQTKQPEHPIDNITRLAKQINSTTSMLCTHPDIEEDSAHAFWLISELAEQIKTEASRISATGEVKE